MLSSLTANTFPTLLITEAEAIIRPQSPFIFFLAVRSFVGR